MAVLTKVREDSARLVSQISDCGALSARMYLQQRRQQGNIDKSGQAQSSRAYMMWVSVDQRRTWQRWLGVRVGTETL